MTEEQIRPKEEKQANTHERVYAEQCPARRTTHADGMSQVLRLAGSSWDEVAARVLKRCARHLMRRPDIEPRDACQGVLVIILCRGFLTRFDPRKGTFWQYVDGIVQLECWRLMRLARRKTVRLDCVDEPAARRRAFDPVAAAMDREFREALADAAAYLTPAERSVFTDVVDRAEGGRRLEGRQGRASIHYARESRCRLRLRSLLIDFAGD